MRQHPASSLLQNSPIDFISGLTGRLYNLCETADITPKTETGKYTLTPFHDTRLNMASPASCLQPVLPTKGLHKAPRLCVLYLSDRNYTSANTEAEQKWCAQSNRWGTWSTFAIPYLLMPSTAQSSATTPCCFSFTRSNKTKNRAC